MVWYYAQDRNRVGPVDDAEFQALVETGVIVPETLVWNETLPNWVRYAEVAMQMPQMSQQQQYTRQGTETCHECGRMFPQDNMIRYQDVWICAGCKPLFVQKIKEGAHLGVGFEYGGFWIRFAAKFLDGLIQSAVTFMGSFMLGMVFAIGGGLSDNGALALQFFVQVLSIAFGVFYASFFIGKFAATPGKMICGLKVVMSDGTRVSYGRAIGRYFAEWLSGLTMGIGYIMAAFDDEKRTLHDRICDTRVVKK
jgi:uncharacterized RDD family membrane protein YckC